MNNSLNISVNQILSATKTHYGCSKQYQTEIDGLNGRALRFTHTVGQPSITFSALGTPLEAYDFPECRNKKQYAIELHNFIFEMNQSGFFAKK